MAFSIGWKRTGYGLAIFIGVVIVLTIFNLVYDYFSDRRTSKEIGAVLEYLTSAYAENGRYPSEDEFYARYDLADKESDGRSRFVYYNLDPFKGQMFVLEYPLNRTYKRGEHYRQPSFEVYGEPITNPFYTGRYYVTSCGMNHECGEGMVVITPKKVLNFRYSGGDAGAIPFSHVSPGSPVLVMASGGRFRLQDTYIRARGYLRYTDARFDPKFFSQIAEDTLVSTGKLGSTVIRYNMIRCDDEARTVCDAKSAIEVFILVAQPGS